MKIDIQNCKITDGNEVVEFRVLTAPANSKHIMIDPLAFDDGGWTKRVEISDEKKAAIAQAIADEIFPIAKTCGGYADAQMKAAKIAARFNS